MVLRGLRKDVKAFEASFDNISDEAIVKFIDKATCFNIGGDALATDFDPLAPSLNNGSSTAAQKYSLFADFVVQEVLCQWISNDKESAHAVVRLAQAIFTKINAELRD
eukprot:4681794-Pyramimonas_sp.AAC.1